VPRRLRLIQAGAGRWGQTWPGVVAAARGWELAAVVDPSPGALEDCGVDRDRCFTSLDEALERVPSDAVLVVTPPATHRDVALRAFAAGRHVLSEKPLTHDPREARQLVAAAGRAGVHLVVSQNYRFRAPARAVERALAEGLIGDLLAVRVVCRRDVAWLVGPGGFLAQQRHPYLLDMAIHHFDLLRALTRREPDEAYARSWPAPGTAFEHDPSVAALLSLDGATVVYDGSWAGGGAETSWNGDWELVGEGGRITWTGGVDDALAGDVVLHPNGRRPRPLRQRRPPHEDRLGPLESLRRAILDGEPAETSGADNLRSLAIAFACASSIERGRPVRVKAP
jgi:predicted dehydrogenase